MAKIATELKTPTNIAAFPAPEFRWHPIYTVPREGRFDVWAKRWVAGEDSFEYRRFTDCFWRATHVGGCPKEWRPTHWCPVLPAPEVAS